MTFSFWVIVSIVYILLMVIALGQRGRTDRLVYGLVITLLYIASIYALSATPTKAELTLEQKAHQAVIETALLQAERGSLVEALDGVIYKITSNDKARDGRVANLLIGTGRWPDDRPYVEFVGNGECGRCSSYYLRVVGPNDPAYTELAIRYAKQ